MKKVLIGILVMIPIIILLIVTAVTNIVSVAAYIGVDSIELEGKDGNQFLSFNLSDIGNNILDLNDYLNVNVLPEKTTNNSVEWSIIDIKYLDVDYEESYNKYKRGESSISVLPAAMLVDENGNEVESNTSGKMLVNAYSIFTIRATAEQHSASISCSIYGYDVNTINVVDDLSNRESTLKVSEKLKLYTYVAPLDSIIDNLEWASSDESIAKVDANGIVTALKEGTTTIYAYAQAYSSKEIVFSTKYIINVTNNLSNYGKSFYTHLDSLTLADYGIYDAEIISGGVINDGILTITSQTAKFYVKDEIVQIFRCNENDIVIENASYLNSDSDEVVEVGGKSLRLKAIYKSVSRDMVPTVEWTSSNEKIAKVDENGTILGISSGLVTITAKYLDMEAKIELNVQSKVAFMQLYTSDNYYSKVIGGLAREVVFASERYIDFNVSKEKEANYTYIVVKGAEEITDQEELNDFYSAYKFEIVDGNRYAFFDENEVNKLIFTSQLEGKGKQEIKVKVSAKYPRYSTLTKYTEEEVTIKAIYGIEVNNIYEWQASTIYQQEYAYKEGNVITVKGDETFSSNPDRAVTTSSKQTYAICLMDDCIFPKDLNDKLYSGYSFSNRYTWIFGDVYGNNHKLMAYKELQTERFNTMFVVRWSNVTISNLDIRANELEDGAEITSGDETTDLNGIGCYVCSFNEYKDRLVNVNFDYCIIENCYHAMSTYNTDIKIDGCILRNTSSSSIYSHTNITNYDGEGYYAQYNNMILNNMVFSNTLGTPFSIVTESYTINCKTGKNNFDEDDTINKQMADEYYNKGYISRIKQTGFMDVYNWQSTEVLNLVQTGNTTADTLLQTISQSIILEKGLDIFRYRYKSVDYANIVGSQYGINIVNGSIMTDEHTNIIEFEDPRIKSFSLSDFADSSDPIIATASKLPVTMYAYKNDANLTPSATYVVNDKLIDKLHS